MRDDLFLEGSTSVAQRPGSRAHPHLVLLAAAMTVLISAATCAGAVLAPAPPVVLPLVVAICVGGPLFAAWEVPAALVSLRAHRAGKALTRLRLNLDQLPETEHPLGL